MTPDILFFALRVMLRIWNFESSVVGLVSSTFLLTNQRQMA